MVPETIQNLIVLALGFAVAGLLSTAYQVVVARPASFQALLTGGFSAYAHVPFLVFAAPFLIVRNSMRRQRNERSNPFYVAAATIVAGMWSLISGTGVIVLLHGIGLV